jgi:hypothetical protein
MAGAAAAFLDTLTPEQRARATFGFDDPERLNWHFIPLQDKQKKSTRKGLPLLDMTDAQRQAAMELLRTGTSEHGFEQARTIMSLESILHELEKNGTNVRNPDWYFFSIFGTPAKTGKWGWRVEGHHLSLNYTVENGQVVSATPAFFGANPATVKAGPKKGLRTLPNAEDLARKLFLALDEQQQKTARQEAHFKEISGYTSAPQLGPPTGLSAGKMTPAQRELLVQLIKAYADRMPADVAAEQMRQVEAGGLDAIHFGWSGGVEPGQPHTYRVQGPKFVVKFLNVQADSAGNPANHIHSAWRVPQGDFALTAR